VESIKGIFAKFYNGSLDDMDYEVFLKPEEEGGDKIYRHHEHSTKSKTSKVFGDNVIIDCFSDEVWSKEHQKRGKAHAEKHQNNLKSVLSEVSPEPFHGLEWVLGFCGVNREMPSQTSSRSKA
jgi:hypothetical protein